MNKLLCWLFGHKWKNVETHQPYLYSTEWLCKRCGKEKYVIIKGDK